ncbi:MAG: hypothetical protein AAF571_07450 [Verrucomicrobiota bacterium]
MDKKVLAWVAAIVSAIWILNPTFGGIIPLEIPDNFPIIGNLDEATMMAILIWAISVIRGKEVDIRGTLFGNKEKDPVADAKPAQKPDEE